MRLIRPMHKAPLEREIRIEQTRNLPPFFGIGLAINFVCKISKLAFDVN